MFIETLKIVEKTLVTWNESCQVARFIMFIHSQFGLTKFVSIHRAISV